MRAVVVSTAGSCTLVGSAPKRRGESEEVNLVNLGRRASVTRSVGLRKEPATGSIERTADALSNALFLVRCNCTDSFMCQKGAAWESGSAQQRQYERGSRPSDVYHELIRLSQR